MKLMDDLKVSVLVPVYGVEKYIERFARSLFSQTMQDGIEFIFVNDDTQDSSISILNRVIDEFPERRKQIRIINHEYNKGLAAARITGVLAAKGEYVAHCDSDDWVEPNMYASMYESAINNNADIVVCDFFEEKVTGSSEVRQVLAQSRQDIVNSICLYELSNQSLAPFLWNRLVKRSFYIDNNLFADVRISFCEDLAVTIPMHLCTDYVTLVKKPLYHYNMMNPGSMTQEKSMKKIESCRLAKENIEGFIRNKGAIGVLPQLNRRWFFYYLPLVTSLEAYDPRLWLKLVDADTEVKLVSRSRVSVWLVRHRMFVLNKLFNWSVRVIFNR